MSARELKVVAVSEPTPEVVALLIDVVAEHCVDRVLGDMEEMIARLRVGAEVAVVARELLRDAPAEIVREALRLRAARDEAAR